MPRTRIATTLANEIWKRLSFAPLLVVATGPLLWGGLSQSRAEEPKPPTDSFALVGNVEPDGAYSLTTQPDGSSAAPSPFSFGLEYSIHTDYIFRGINFSEFPGEGRELPNHQLSVDVGVDLGLLLDGESGSLGTLGFNTWLEWFGGQKNIDPIGGGQNLQETDYTITWSTDIESIGSTLTLGYIFYAFPNAKAINTQEWTVTLEHNDAWMWKWLWPENEEGVLNPSIFYAMDVDAAAGGSWIEFGFSHDFSISEHVTLTPSLLLASDHRWLDPILATGRTGSTRLAFVQYGITLGYDLSAAWNIPEGSGAWSMSGFVYLNDAVGDPEDRGLIQDEFFGGVSIGVSF